MTMRRRLIQALLVLSISLIFVPDLDAHGGDPDLIHACINNDEWLGLLALMMNVTNRNPRATGYVFDRAKSQPVSAS